MTTTVRTAATDAPAAGARAVGRRTADPRRRRATAWVVIAVVLVAAGIAAAVLSSVGQWTKRDMLDPESAGPDGAQALAHILRDHGVQVQVARDRDALDQALSAAGRTESRAAVATLVLPDSPLLSDKTFQGLADAADDVVIAQPQSRSARLLFDSGASGYGADAPVAPGCALPAAQRAGAIVPGALYTLPQGRDVTACYRVGPDAALLQRTTAGTTATIVDGTALLTNAALAQHGNAALGITLMGVHPTLIWYIPSARDADAGAATPTLGQLTPPWVSPVIVLLLAAGVGAGIWRGRRFGPLVAESLPVTVRAAETTQGRARLYARSRDTAHVADRLRIGALTRLARLLGIGTTAAADETSDAVADLLRMPRARVRGILRDDPVGTDRELLALSDRLRELERAAHRALHPASDTTGTTEDQPPTDTGRTHP
nr:DUF4350 domain-containing protein [Microbacterium bovistercoris]